MPAAGGLAGVGAVGAVNGEARLPPGPGFIAALGFLRAPIAFLDDCARRYGDWFTVRFPGVPPYVFTSDPDAIRETFVGDPEIFRAGEANAPLGAFMGTHSILLLDGAPHLRERRILLPPFHGERMQAYGSLMRAVTDRAVAAWPVGRPFAFHRAMQEITLETILRAVFGFDDGPEVERLRNALARLFAIYGGPLATLLALPPFRVDLGPWSPWGRVVRLRREIETILLAEFARRRAAPDASRADVLSLLLAARDDDGAALPDTVLRDEMLTLMLAGHETTAASLAWATWRLLEHRDVLGHLRDDVAAGRRELLDAVVKESGRLDPVVPNVGRRLAVPARIGDRVLPAGAVLAPCIYLAHRRPGAWPEPERFDPGRFLGARPAPVDYFPFGGGVRRCLGAAFATFQMRVVLGRLVERVDLEPAPGYRPRVVRCSIAFAPSEGMPVVRRGAPA